MDVPPGPTTLSTVKSGIEKFVGLAHDAEAVRFLPLRPFLCVNGEPVGRKYLATFLFLFDFSGVLLVLLCLIGEGPALLCPSMRSEFMVVARSKISSRSAPPSVASPPGPSPSSSRSSGGGEEGGGLRCSSYRLELADDNMSKNSLSCCDSDFGRLRCDSFARDVLGSSSLRLANEALDPLRNNLERKQE